MKNLDFLSNLCYGITREKYMKKIVLVTLVVIVLLLFVAAAATADCGCKKKPVCKTCEKKAHVLR